jgi:flagellar hook assembly protein FlgD
MNITEIDKNKNSNIPLQYYLEQNFPNPFNPSTTIQYNLPNQEQVKLNVYNVLGQLVKTLVNSFQSAGFHSVIWDGSNNNGQKVSSGIYFYKIDAGKFINIKKMILIK